MYPRSFLCKKAKIKQRTSSKKNLCEIGEEAIWESWFTSFFEFFYPARKKVIGWAVYFSPCILYLIESLSMAWPKNGPDHVEYPINTIF